MTPIKLFAAIVGTAMVLATAATSANAENYQRNGQGYSYQAPTGQHFGDRRVTDQRQQFRHVAPRGNVYVVPVRDLRRYVARNGRYSLHGPRFKRWVVSNGRPLRFHTASFRQNNSGYGFGWYRPRQPQWAYINLRTGRIWF